MKHVVLVTRISRASELLVDPVDGLPFNTPRAAAEAAAEDESGNLNDPIMACELLTLGPSTQADVEAFERHFKKVSEDGLDGEGVDHYATDAAAASQLEEEAETFHVDALPPPKQVSVESFIACQEQEIDPGK